MFKYLIVLLTLLPLTAHADATKEYVEAFHTMHQDMDISYTGDVDTDFTRGMIPHHQGAVDMAKVALKYGSDPEIRDFAKWIIYIQEIEISQMKHWLTRFATPKNTKVCYFNDTAVAEFKQQMIDMHREMDIVYTGNADVDLVMGMIPHHQAAIDMAHTLLRHGLNPELDDLAWGIIRSQSSEIAFMKRWLARQGIDFDATHAEYMQKNTSKKKHHMHH